MLRIIAGRAKSGKSEICSREFAEFVASGRDGGAYFIVPEQYAVEAEHRILSLDAMQGRSLFEAEVLSFKRLIHRILSRFGGGGGNVLSRSGRAMLLISSLSAISGEMEWFKDIREKPSMVLSLLKLIDEFETYNSDRADLERKLAELAASGNAGSPKYKDLARIYREFSRRMSEAYTSVGDACDNACLAAYEHGFFRGATIWIDEFTGFTDPELRLIECMLRSGAEVTVSLCTSRDTEPVFKAIDRTLDRLRELAINVKAGFRVDTAEELLPRAEHFRRVRTFELLEQYYTKCKTAAIPEAELDAGEAARCVRLVKARDNYSELKAAAAQIRKLHDEEGFPYGSIVVAVRNIGDYSAYAGPVFTKAGIPFYVDDMHSVTSDPVVLTLIGLLDLVIYDMAREDVAALLKNGMLIDDRSRVDVLDNIILAKNMRGPRAFQRAGNDGNAEFSALYAIFKRIEAVFAGAATVAEAVDGFRGVLSDLELESRANRLADLLKDSPAPEKAEELSRIWNMIVELFEQIKILLGTEAAHGAATNNARLTAAQLKAYIETGFAGLEMGFIPQDRNTVRMIGTGRSRPGAPRALLLLGANEGVMPANISSGGIVRDSERDVIIGAGIGLADDSLIRAYKELFMVYSVLFAPSERLYISYAIKNSEGDEIEPSAAVVKKLEKILSISDAAEYTAGEAAGSSDAVTELTAGNARFYIDAELAEEVFRPDGELLLSISQIESYNKCPLAYFLDSKLRVREREECELESGALGSIVHSVLEKCGIELSKTVPSMAADRLEPFSAELVDKYFDGAVNAQYADLNESYSPKDRLIVDRLKGFCRNVVLAIARQQHGVINSPGGASNYGPIAFEYTFGMSADDLPAVEVKLYDDGTDEAVKLNGKIDRLDAFTDGTRYYINVVDYKSSKKNINGTDVRNGINIQLLVYLKAATGTKAAREVIARLIRDNSELARGIAEIPESDIQPAAGLYLVYDDAIKSESSTSKQEPYAMTGVLVTADVNAADMLNSKEKANVIYASNDDLWDEDTFTALSESTDEAVKTTAHNMLAGRFGAAPRSYAGKYGPERSCIYCAFSGICGIEPAGRDKEK